MYFFGRGMILLLVVDSIRSLVTIDYDNVPDTEHKVISVEKKKFQFISIMDIAPFFVKSVTKFEQYVTVLCCVSPRICSGISHIRIYESTPPFNLLFAINTDEIDHPIEMAWNEKAESLFVISKPNGIWQIKWEDHLVRKFPCSVEGSARFLSTTDDGNVLIRGLLYDPLYVCSVNGLLIRKISFVHNIFYRLGAPFKEAWLFDSLLYYRVDIRWAPYNVALRLKDWNDLNAELILDVNATNERNIASSDTERFSFFFMSLSPGKCEDFDLYKLTIERRSKSPKHLAAGYSASDEGLLSEFLSNRGGRFSYGSHGERCNVPSYKSVRVSYHYDSDNYQLIVGLSSDFMKDQVYIVQCVPR